MSSGVILKSLGIPIGLFENPTALHEKSCMKAENERIWTGGTTSSKDTCI